MIITSWNVNSVRARIENIKEYLQKFSPDVVMMQEIKTQDETFPYDDFSALDYESHVFGQKSYNGVAIISKHKLENDQFLTHYFFAKHLSYNPNKYNLLFHHECDGKHHENLN